MAGKVSIEEMAFVCPQPGMEKIKMASDIVREREDGSTLTLDRYLPSGKGSAVPGIIFVHGGPVRDGMVSPREWNMFRSYGRLAAVSGFMGLMFEHRYSGKDGVDRAKEDVRDVLACIRDRSGEWGLDADRICVWMFSGAGKLFPAVLEVPDCPPFALMLSYALMDTKGLGKNALAALRDKPVGVVKAGNDRANINDSLDAFASLAKEAGARVKEWDLPWAHHGFEIVDDTDESRATIEETMVFLKERMLSGLLRG